MKLHTLVILSLFSLQAVAADKAQSAPDTKPAPASNSKSSSGGNSIDFSKLYVGAGLGINSLSGYDSATGFQFFAGIPLNLDAGGFNWFAEVGYMDSGDFSTSINTGFGTFSSSTNVSGLWGTIVAAKPINEKLDFVGRAGLDIGDDDGIMFGAGVGMNLNEKSDVRFEYVIRDNVNSIQANFVYRM